MAYKVTEMAAEYTGHNWRGAEGGTTTAVYKIEPPLPSVGDTFLQGVVEGGRNKQRLNHLVTTDDATYLSYEPYGKYEDEQMTCVRAVQTMLDKALEQLNIGSAEGLLDMMHNDHVVYDEGRAAGSYNVMRVLEK